MPGSDLVLLPGGYSVPAPAALLALDLEARGLVLEADGNDLYVSPLDRLTDADYVAIRAWKPSLLKIARVCDLVE